MATFQAEFAVRGYVLATFRTDEFEPSAALLAELRAIGQLDFALWALHCFPFLDELGEIRQVCLASKFKNLTEWISPDLIALYIDCISSRHEKLYCRTRDIYSGPLRLESIFQYRTLVGTGQPGE